MNRLSSTILIQAQESSAALAPAAVEDEVSVMEVCEEVRMIAKCLYDKLLLSIILSLMCLIFFVSPFHDVCLRESRRLAYSFLCVFSHCSQHSHLVTALDVTRAAWADLSFSVVDASKVTEAVGQ